MSLYVFRMGMYIYIYTCNKTCNPPISNDSAQSPLLCMCTHRLRHRFTEHLLEHCRYLMHAYQQTSIHHLTNCNIIHRSCWYTHIHTYMCLHRPPEWGVFICIFSCTDIHAETCTWQACASESCSHSSRRARPDSS